jgi:hypothetical protein
LSSGFFMRGPHNLTAKPPVWDLVLDGKLRTAASRQRSPSCTRVPIAIWITSPKTCIP